MFEKQEIIINMIDNHEKIKEFKRLEKIIKNNKKYNELLNNFNKNKDKYINDNSLNKEIINLRKELFKINEIKDYLKLEKEIRLLTKDISNILTSIIDNHTC
jgi:cell fate (sporulation/competence/biofilm development) regulator YmcA (YheA/YmcA/DUF963 family)